MSQQKKLKLIISSLKQKDLFQFFELFTSYCMGDVTKNIKKISYSCYEAQIDNQQYSFSAYGKNHNEAFNMAIINFFQKILAEERYYNDVKYCIRKFVQNHGENSNQKIKTLPDACNERKSNLYIKTMDNLKPKENIMKSMKTIKEQIFQTLNHDNIKLKQSSETKPGFLSKNSSYSLLGLANNQPCTNSTLHQKNLSNISINNITKTEEMSLADINKRIKDLQQKLQTANDQNQYLKKRLNEKETKEQLVRINSKIMKSEESELHVLQNNYLKDISSKFNHTTSNQINPDDKKTRSYSLSNSINHSAFNSKPPKMKIPKLNLGILPNYHGKSNKSLNQSMLETYEKKYKIPTYNL